MEVFISVIPIVTAVVVCAIMIVDIIENKKRIAVMTRAAGNKKAFPRKIIFNSENGEGFYLCGNCRKPIDTDDRWCGKCGTMVDWNEWRGENGEDDAERQ